jgi:hypothetical protein
VITPSDQSEPLFREEADQIKTIHHQLIGMGKIMIERMIEAGEIMTRVKHGLPHGSWMPWVEKNIPELSYRTIARYMRVYKRRDDPLLQEHQARFIAEIMGHNSKLESDSTAPSNLTPASSLNPESEIPSNDEEGIPDTGKPPENKPPDSSTPPLRKQVKSEVEQAKYGITENEANKLVYFGWEKIKKDQNPKACRYLATAMVLHLFHHYKGLKDDVLESND